MSDYCCAKAEEDEPCDCHEPKGAWMICPHCSGDGKHSKRFGAMSQTEFYEYFDDPDDREAYFAGAYDQTCYTCQGTGKIREGDEEADLRYERDREAELIANTGRNSAGEPCW